MRHETSLIIAAPATSVTSLCSNGKIIRQLEWKQIQTESQNIVASTFRLIIDSTLIQFAVSLTEARVMRVCNHLSLWSQYSLYSTLYCVCTAVAPCLCYNWFDTVRNYKNKPQICIYYVCTGHSTGSRTRVHLVFAIQCNSRYVIVYDTLMWPIISLLTTVT